MQKIKIPQTKPATTPRAQILECLHRFVLKHSVINWVSAQQGRSKHILSSGRRRVAITPMSRGILKYTLRTLYSICWSHLFQFWSQNEYKCFLDLIKLVWESTLACWLENDLQPYTLYLCPCFQIQSTLAGFIYEFLNISLAISTGKLIWNTTLHICPCFQIQSSPAGGVWRQLQEEMHNCFRHPESAGDGEDSSFNCEDNTILSTCLLT